MAVLFDKDKKELMITCRCECENSLHIKIDQYWSGEVALVSYTNGNFYRDQNGAWYTIKKKIKKIWAIIRNCDIYYSDIQMTCEDFEQFREFVNSVELE